MNVFIFVLLLLIYITTGNSFVHKKISYKNNILINHKKKNFILKHEYKIYHLNKEKNLKRVQFSKERVFSNISDIIRTENIKKIIHVLSIYKIKKAFTKYFLYFNYVFNKCKLDRILIAINVYFYLYLNRININEEKKIYFYKGSLIKAKEEQKCEKYKCNYDDIYKNKNYKTLFTSLFIHKNILHLYFNMSSLTSIYKLISTVYSNSQIINIFLLSGVLSNYICYLYHIKEKNKKVFFNDLLINQNNLKNKNAFFNQTNKIICGSSSAIYSLYGMHITHILFFYFKYNYIINVPFLYNFIYSFLTSLFLENVSHLNHIVGFLCGFFFSFLTILFDN
ncbi:rhomboid protease ROM7 [Hepatocystis sp. ex Piliocolobus tephrosceles]|nr:rhomboid protease ROM7 [Hepatocystis sp. ex Piliocolobus tephrosceles]